MSITKIGQTGGRQPHRIFGIKEADRLSHVYLIGRTGTGKSQLLKNMAWQDIQQGKGLAVIDPHGDLVTALRASTPAHRINDLVFFNPADIDQPYSYNPLFNVPPAYIPLAASGLLEAFKKLWQTDWGTRMEHILRNCLFALLEMGDATLPDILRLLTDKSFRYQVTSKLQNEQVRNFWQSEFPKYNPRYRQEMIAPIQNKVGAFLADPRLRQAVTNTKQPIRLRRMMDERKILLVNLSKGLFGDDSASLLGSLLVTAISLAGLSRENIPEHRRTPFYLYLDEFQNVTTTSVANLVSELRKFGLSLTAANQHLAQLEPEVMHAMLGNCGTIISFRIGAKDAPVLSREFESIIRPEELVSLPNYQIYLKLMINGTPSKPFSASTLTQKYILDG